MNNLLFKILEVVVTVAFTAACRYLIPWIQIQLRQSKYDLLADIIGDAVYGVEQSIQGDAMGEKRKSIVHDYAVRACEKYKIPFNAEQIDMLIEAAVKGMKDASTTHHLTDADASV